MSRPQLIQMYLGYLIFIWVLEYVEVIRIVAIEANNSQVSSIYAHNGNI